jgi:hypothetical protein
MAGSAIRHLSASASSCRDGYHGRPSEPGRPAQINGERLATGPFGAIVGKLGTCGALGATVGACVVESCHATGTHEPVAQMMLVTAVPW